MLSISALVAAPQGVFASRSVLSGFCTAGAPARGRPVDGALEGGAVVALPGVLSSAQAVARSKVAKVNTVAVTRRRNSECLSCLSDRVEPASSCRCQGQAPDQDFLRFLIAAAATLVAIPHGSAKEG